MSFFTSARMQEISDLALIASIQNDLESLKDLQKIVEEPDPDGFSYLLGNEWFYSLLTADQIAYLNS